MSFTIQLRRDTAANWTSNNPVLEEAVQGYELDTKKMKIGDGTTAWNSLEYYSTGGGGESEIEYYLDCTTTSSANPYILGSNGETEIICWSSDTGISELAFIELPIPMGTPVTEREIACDAIARGFEHDQEFKIDVSSYGTWQAIVLSRSWTRTNNNVSQDSRGLRTKYPDLPEGLVGITLRRNTHLGLEFYPEGPSNNVIPENGEDYIYGSWHPTGPIGYILTRTLDGEGLEAVNTGDGFGNDAALDRSGMITRWTLSEDEYREKIGLDYKLNCIDTSPENPYIAGSNGETEVICFTSDSNISNKAFIALPTPYENPQNDFEVRSNAIAQRLSADSGLSVDVSYFGCDEAIIGTVDWTHTNNLIQNNERDIKSVYPTLSDYMLYAIRLNANSHIEFEFYPRDEKPYTQARWNVSGGMGTMLTRAGDLEDGVLVPTSDGFGNNAELDSRGFVTRWTVNEAQWRALNSGITGEYIIGDKTLTISSGIITGIA